MFKITIVEAIDASVPVEDKWMTNTHKFLSSGLPPEDMNRDEWKRLAL